MSGFHSDAYRIGRPYREGGRGGVTVWLEDAGTASAAIGVNAFNLSAVSVTVSIVEARELRDALDALIREDERCRSGRRRGRDE